MKTLDPLEVLKYSETFATLFLWFQITLNQSTVRKGKKSAKEIR